MRSRPERLSEWHAPRRSDGARSLPTSRSAWSFSDYLGGAPPDMIAWRSRALQMIRSDPARRLQLAGTDLDVLRMSPREASGVLEGWRKLLPTRFPGVVPERAAGHRELNELLEGGHENHRLRRFVRELNDHLAAEHEGISRLGPVEAAVVETGQRRLAAKAAALARDTEEGRADTNRRSP